MEVELRTTENAGFDINNDEYASMNLTIEKYKIDYPFSTNIFSSFKKKVLCTHCSLTENLYYQKTAPTFFINCFRKLNISNLSNSNNIYARLIHQNNKTTYDIQTKDDALPKTLNEE